MRNVCISVENKHRMRNKPSRSPERRLLATTNPVRAQKKLRSDLDSVSV